MNIRSITESDSEQFLLLGKTLDQETQFMMLEPGERTLTAEEQRQRIKSVLSQDNQMIFVVEHEGRLVGFLGAYGGGVQRNRYSAYIVIGIYKLMSARESGENCSKRLTSGQLGRNFIALS